MQVRSKKKALLFLAIKMIDVFCIFHKYSDYAGQLPQIQTLQSLANPTWERWRKDLSQDPCAVDMAKMEWELTVTIA